MALLSFTYPITRPYPFKWFKWVVIVGGICAVALFSTLNFAANGYNLNVSYKSDPNQTVADGLWTQKFPFNFNAKTKPTCQPQNLQVGGQLYTDKLSLVYTLTQVQLLNSGDLVKLPSLQYTNNQLEDCTVSEIQLNLESFDRTAAQQGSTSWGLDALATVSCLIQNEALTWINMTVRYDVNVGQSYNSSADIRFVQEPKNQTSLWWGESLLSWYYLKLIVTMSQVGVRSDLSILKGTVSFQPSLVSNITSLRFFEAPGYSFVWNYRGSDPEYWAGSPQCCINVAQGPSDPTVGGLHAAAFWPDIWIEADIFAKAYYSTILADLGQAKATNILSDPQALSYFSQNITTMADPSSGLERGWFHAGPARAPYLEEDSGTMANLTITPSVFFNQYLCQIPAVKSTGSLILAVLVADLVFLQVAWTILNWLTAMRLRARDPTADHCVGCHCGADHAGEHTRTSMKRASSANYRAIPDIQLQDLQRHRTRHRARARRYTEAY